MKVRAAPKSKHTLVTRKLVNRKEVKSKLD